MKAKRTYCDSSIIKPIERNDVGPVSWSWGIPATACFFSSSSSCFFTSSWEASEKKLGGGDTETCLDSQDTTERYGFFLLGSFSQSNIIWVHSFSSPPFSANKALKSSKIDCWCFCSGIVSRRWVCNVQPRSERLGKMSCKFMDNHTKGDIFSEIVVSEVIIECIMPRPRTHLLHAVGHSVQLHSIPLPSVQPMPDLKFKEWGAWHGTLFIGQWHLGIPHSTATDDGRCIAAGSLGKCFANLSLNWQAML